MTELEKYKARITNLTDRLDSVRYTDVTEINNDMIFPLIVQSSHTLKEMMVIIENVGIANGVMADALRIMSNEA